VFKFRAFFRVFVGIFFVSFYISVAAAKQGNSNVKIDNRVPPNLSPISEALTAHWDFLYKQADPEALNVDPKKKAFTETRIKIHSDGIKKALLLLRSKGFEKDTGKALVMGGAYETDLNPLLDLFAEVHVTDLSPRPLELIHRIYKKHPNHNRLRLVLADLSGIPPVYQAEAMKQFEKAGDANDKGSKREFFAKMPELVETPFPTGSYALVVSPLLVECLPYGPLVFYYEGVRAAKGKDAPRKHIITYLGEEFFYDPMVMASFRRVFLHHSAELQRLVVPNGVVVFSVWKSEDDRQAEIAPERKEKLLRIGDDRVTKATWDDFFKRWATVRFLGGTHVYGPDKKPTMNVFILEAHPLQSTAHLPGAKTGKNPSRKPLSRPGF
jgi:hypothetical protein